MMHWYVYVLKNCLNFQGRAHREEYWMFFLVNIVVGFVIGILDAMLGTQILGVIYTVAIILPALAVGVRRLHDTDRSGWWWLISMIPVAGTIAILVLFSLEGTHGDNRFGEDPRN